MTDDWLQIHVTNKLPDLAGIRTDKLPVVISYDDASEAIVHVAMLVAMLRTVAPAIAVQREPGIATVIMTRVPHIPMLATVEIPPGGGQNGSPRKEKRQPRGTRDNRSP